MSPQRETQILHQPPFLFGPSTETSSSWHSQQFTNDVPGNRTMGGQSYDWWDQESYSVSHLAGGKMLCRKHVLLCLLKMNKRVCIISDLDGPRCLALEKGMK